MEQNQLKELVTDLNEALPLTLSGANYDHLVQQLNDYVNDLIDNDFNRLVALLYRLDISETQLRKILNEVNDLPSSTVITGLIIERQLQKIESRKAFKKDDNIPDDDKW